MVTGNFVFEDSVFKCNVNANDSIIFGIYDSWEDLKNHPKWFTKFEISPVDGIQMNDPYLPENWVECDTPLPSIYFGDYNTYVIRNF